MAPLSTAAVDVSAAQFVFFFFASPHFVLSRFFGGAFALVCFIIHDAALMRSPCLRICMCVCLFEWVRAAPSTPPLSQSHAKFANAVYSRFGQSTFGSQRRRLKTSARSALSWMHLHYRCKSIYIEDFIKKCRYSTSVRDLTLIFFIILLFLFNIHSLFSNMITLKYCILYKFTVFLLPNMYFNLISWSLKRFFYKFET